MGHVADVLTAKGSQVFAIGPDASVYQAVELMVRHNVGSLVVVRGDALIGIFTERDHLRRVTLRDLDPRSTPIGDVMTERVITIRLDSSIEECMTIMTRERIRHLPVVDQDRTVGMISIGDVVKVISRNQAVEIRSLTEYITGAAQV